LVVLVEVREVRPVPLRVRSAGPFHIGGYIYDSNGHVLDYGSPNAEKLCQVPVDSTGDHVRIGPLHAVLELRECWNFWCVKVYSIRFGQWELSLVYCAATWADIREVWKTFFQTAGFYDRLAWSCEAWSWTGGQRSSAFVRAGRI
jgi:hypothetical protein